MISPGSQPGEEGFDPPTVCSPSFTTDNRKEMRIESDVYVGPKVAFRKVGGLLYSFGSSAGLTSVRMKYATPA